MKGTYLVTSSAFLQGMKMLPGILVVKPGVELSAGLMQVQESHLWLFQMQKIQLQELNF